MKQIEYVNSIPPIPEHLLESIDVIKTTYHGHGRINDEGQWVAPDTPGSRQVTSITAVSEELKEWIKNNVPYECILEPTELYYLCIYPDVPLHKDYFIGDPEAKHIGLNYLITLGGDNVVTNLYDDDEKTILQSIKLEERKWIKFPICVNHTIDNITNAPRVMVRVTPVQSISWDDIK